MGCHSTADMAAAASAAGNGELMERFKADYPVGPHDKPQSMCPAFGSLRTGLRMRRVGTIISGSACCTYGLSFVSHFYGARRSIGYVPSIRNRSSRASCSRTSARRSTRWPIRSAMTRSW